MSYSLIFFLSPTPLLPSMAVLLRCPLRRRAPSPHSRAVAARPPLRAPAPPSAPRSPSSRAGSRTRAWPVRSARTPRSAIPVCRAVSRVGAAGSEYRGGGAGAEYSGGGRAADATTDGPTIWHGRAAFCRGTGVLELDRVDMFKALTVLSRSSGAPTGSPLWSRNVRLRRASCGRA